MSDLGENVQKEEVLLLFENKSWKYGEFQKNLKFCDNPIKDKYVFVCYYAKQKNIGKEDILTIENEDKIINNYKKGDINNFKTIIVSPNINDDRELLRNLEKDFNGRIFLYNTLGIDIEFRSK